VAGGPPAIDLEERRRTERRQREMRWAATEQLIATYRENGYDEAADEIQAELDQERQSVAPACETRPVEEVS
ncbi:MAG: hypothetical protein M3P34_04335, partial [Actinomycetota bacterium]|nr:hypothetical protein [Actinomycetota bacterium]